jgi:uncharacterized protein (TIGR04255 family)
LKKYVEKRQNSLKYGGVNMLHLDYSTFKIDKIFIEVRFKDSFKLPLTDTKYTILEKLTKKYPAYNIENPEHIFLANPSEQKQIHVHLNRIIIDWDKPVSIDDFIKSSQADMAFLLRCLDVNDLIRVGIRTLSSYEGNNQNAISEFIFKEFISTKLKSSDFGDEFTNPRVQFSGRKGSLFFNFALAYQQEQIIQGDLGAPLENQIRDLFLIDLDCYKENLKVSKLNTVLVEIKDMNLKIPNYIRAIKE